MQARIDKLRERGDQVVDLAGTLRRDEAGATAIEYGLIVGLVSFAIIGALMSIQGVLGDNVFAVVASALANI
ncbi:MULTISPECIES: Flp family type IVb pilin [unclassified Stappia]|uniref:Flp family type IVb pilin n=1 Tax=unclassified Stappia TaxID=2629676 RepID=UPI0016437418|nr:MULTISPECIES: Flp family type IVb pilin [unclassified Stappia]